MQQRIAKISRAVLLRDYPIVGQLEGWFFRQMESSAGIWLIEGRDEYGRCVSRSGTDETLLLAQCIEDAKHLGKQ